MALFLEVTPTDLVVVKAGKKTARPDAPRRGAILSALRMEEGDGYVGVYVVFRSSSSQARGRRVSARSNSRRSPPPRRGRCRRSSSREEWQQRARPSDAPADLVLEGGVTPSAVTSAALELKSTIRTYPPASPRISTTRRRARSARLGRTFVRAARGLQPKSPPQKSRTARRRTRRISGRASARRRSRSRSAIARAMSISRDSRTSAGSHALPGFTSCAQS